MSTSPAEPELQLSVIDLHAARLNGTVHFPGAATDRAPLGQIGDFDILAELGSGRAGWVFRARERSLNRIVALKVLRPETKPPDEAVVGQASFKHEHIVTVYRLEKPAGFPPCLVMEYVEGESLAARLLREERLSPEAAANLTRQVALGLAASQERG